MEFRAFAWPIEGIEKVARSSPRNRGAYGMDCRQLDSGRMDYAYHNENHATAMPSPARIWSGSMALCRWLNSPTAKLKRSGVSSIKCSEFWKACANTIYARVERMP
jgi:hypothetical protein